MHPHRIAGAVLCALLWAGCAASPAEQLDGSSLEQGDDDADQADAALPPRPDESDRPDEVVRDAAVDPPRAARDGGTEPGEVGQDASAPDGATPLEASTVPEGPARDASVAADAAQAPVVDAAPPREAGAPSTAGDGGGSAAEAGVPPGDAGMSVAPGRCDRSSQCESLCLFVGVFPCCRADHTCGCTWAPGAYCL